MLKVERQCVCVCVREREEATREILLERSKDTI